MTHRTVEPAKRPSSRSLAFLFLGIALFASLVFFWRLGDFPVTDVDEAIHAMVTREMRTDHDFLTLKLLGANYFRKPPLAFWLRAGAESVFGESAFSLRFFSAVAGVATTLILAWWAWLLSRRPLPPIFVGLVFPFLPISQIHTFRNGDTDGIFIALTTAAAFFFFRSLKRQTHLLTCALFLGLAFMTKSAAMFVVPAACVVFLLVYRRWPYSLRHVLAALGVFCVVALPWHIRQLIVFGRTFWDDYVGHHVIARATDQIEISSKLHGAFWYFQKSFEKGMFPWAWLVIPAALLLFTMSRNAWRKRPDEWFLVMCGISTLVLFSLAATKFDWYIAPAFGPFVVLIALALVTPFERIPTWLRLTIVGIGVLFLLRVVFLFHSGIRSALPFGTLMTSRMAVLDVVLLVVLASGVFFAKRRFRFPFLNTLVAAGFIPIFIIGCQSWLSYEHARVASPFQVFQKAILKKHVPATVYIYDKVLYSKPVTHFYLADAGRSLTLTPLYENSLALENSFSDSVDSYLVVDRNELFPADIQDRLSLVTTSTSLALYAMQTR